MVRPLKTEERPLEAARVVVLNDWLTPYRVPLFRQLAAEVPGLRVLLCADKIRDYAWRFDEDLGFACEALPHLELRLRRPPYDQPRILLFNPTLLWRLLRLRPDVVVTYAFSVPTWTAALYCALTGTPYLSWNNDTPHTERHLGRLQRLSRRWLIPRAAACLTASAEGCEKFLSFGARPERIFQVLQVPDVEAFAERAAEARRRARPPRDPVALYVGHVTRLKGLDHLLRAFRLVHDRLPRARLRLVGDGPQRCEYRALAAQLGLADAVDWVDFVQQDQLPALYARADAFVFPTLSDTFGTVLAEAAACGLPLVASPFAGATGELVEPGVTGHVVDPHDHTALAEALTDLLGDPTRARAWGEAGLRRLRARGGGRPAAAFLAGLEAALGAGPSAPRARRGAS